MVFTIVISISIIVPELSPKTSKYHFKIPSVCFKMDGKCFLFGEALDVEKSF